MRKMLFIVGVLFLLQSVSMSAAQEVGIRDEKVREAMNKAVAYLRSTQAPSGAWEMPAPSGAPERGMRGEGGEGRRSEGGSGREGRPDAGNAEAGRQRGSRGGRGSASMAAVGPTAVILAGLFDADAKFDDPMMTKGMAFLKFAAQEDGGIYTKDGFFQNYETCVAVMAFASANDAYKKANSSEVGPYDELLVKAQKYLLKNQYTEQRDVTPDDMRYGGIGYGGDSRPDLSNTQFFLDAMVATGKKADDPAIQKALIFVSRCQNLESEHNTQDWASKNPDGGFVYTARSSSAGETAEGGLKSYASMTYAGFKSMIYAGLTMEDKRVKAAFDWIAKHYSVKENPGLGQTGVYYYYQTMAKALDVLKLNEIEDAEGKKRAWKVELSDELLSRQREDGSWINNESNQYMENNPNLVTGFVLLVLADCLK